MVRDLRGRLTVYIKNGLEIPCEDVQNNLKRIINQVYKLLPTREEEGDWIKPLETVVEELYGMDRLLIGQHQIFFTILCKLEGLFLLTSDRDFGLYRRTIFEVLSLLNSLKECLV